MASAPPCNEEPTPAKSVLVCVGHRKRPVSFTSGEGGGDRVRLLVAANEIFKGLAVFDAKTVIQIKSEEWRGEFIDVEDKDLRYSS